MATATKQRSTTGQRAASKPATSRAPATTRSGTQADIPTVAETQRFQDLQRNLSDPSCVRMRALFALERGSLTVAGITDAIGASGAIGGHLSRLVNMEACSYERAATKDKTYSLTAKGREWAACLRDGISRLASA